MELGEAELGTTDKQLAKIWRDGDDVSQYTRSLGELYENVPDSLKDIDIDILEIHSFPKEHFKRIQAFLNSDNFVNSLEFIKDED